MCCCLPAETRMQPVCHFFVNLLFVIKREKTEEDMDISDVGIEGVVRFNLKYQSLKRATHCFFFFSPRNQK